MPKASKSRTSKQQDGPKFGEVESYSVGSWVEIQRKKKCGPGKVARRHAVAGHEVYTVQTIDGTVHVGLSAALLKPRGEIKVLKKKKG